MEKSLGFVLLALLWSAPALAQLTPVSYAASFELAAPPTWDVYRDLGQMRLIALSPKEGETDTFQENVNVVLEGMLPGITWDAYMERNDLMMAQGLVDYEQVDRTQVEVAGHPALRSVYLHTLNGQRLQVLSYTLQVEARVYVVTCTAPEPAFAAHLDTFEAIAQSLSID